MHVRHGRRGTLARLECRCRWVGWLYKSFRWQRLCRCQSTLAVIVASREAFPPTRPPETELSRRAGGWERQPSRTPQLRRQCIGTGMASSWVKAAAAKGRLQSPGATWNSPMAALVALLLVHLLLPKHIGRHCGSSGGIPTHPAPTKWSQAAGLVGGRDKPHERRTCGQGALGPIAATLEPTTLAAVELWPGWSLAHGEFVCRQSCGIGGASVTASARWLSSLRSRNCPTRPSWCQPTLAGWCRCDQ